MLANVQEDSGEFSEKFWGMFRKIPGNALSFKLIKATFCLNKANVKIFSEARPIFGPYLIKQ